MSYFPFPLLLAMPSGMPAYLTAAVGATVITGHWQIFVKARRKGWESIVPVWNVVGIALIVGRPWWWGLGLLPGPLALGLFWSVGLHRHPMVLLALPAVCVSLWMHWRISMDLARSFGRSRRFGWRLVLLPIVYIPLLGWGYSEYVRPGAQSVRDTKAAPLPKLPANTSKTPLAL